jgi:hypothetical protein
LPICVIAQRVSEKFLSDFLNCFSQKNFNSIFLGEQAKSSSSKNRFIHKKRCQNHTSTTISTNIYLFLYYICQKTRFIHFIIIRHVRRTKNTFFNLFSDGRRKIILMNKFFFCVFAKFSTLDTYSYTRHSRQQ